MQKCVINSEKLHKYQRQVTPMTRNAAGPSVASAVAVSHEVMAQLGDFHSPHQTTIKF
jgi:hypothetical protein